MIRVAPPTYVMPPTTRLEDLIRNMFSLNVLDYFIWNHNIMTSTTLINMNKFFTKARPDLLTEIWAMDS